MPSDKIYELGDYRNIMSPRSDKDPVPEFENPEDALAWMEAKLNGSWVDAITDEPKPVESFRTPVLPIGPAGTSQPTRDTASTEPLPSINPTSTGYRPDMTADELATFLDAMWNDETGQS